MTTVSWTKAYSVGVPALDSDHRNLFEIIETVDRALQKKMGKEKIAKAIAGLIQYTEEHFQREEKLMERYDYPDLEKHKTQHRNLEKTVHALYRVYQVEPKSVDTKKLMEFLNHWLGYHIISVDMKYAKYIESLYLSGQVPEFVNTPDKTKTVTLEVTAENAWLLKRCDVLLNRGEEEALTILEVADPASNMTLSVAKKLAHKVLCNT